jgi:signal transduction histidine kinase
VTEPLRVLIVEDAEDDALLLVRELRRGGYAVVFERVETEEQMTAALDRQPWDLVLADYALPRFSGPRALALVKGRGLDLPFIIVSGTIGEETAVAAMKAGAHDYLMKGHLARLVPAIQREVGDAEERRQRIAMEQVARRAEKLAALGTLAAGLAHELNNPIGIMSSRIELMLREGAALPAEVRDDLTVLHRMAQRVARITEGLLSFARQSSGERMPVDLNHIVEETLFLAERHMTEEGVRFVTTLAPRLPPILGDANTLQQVVLNLITNARDAVGGHGEVRIETRVRYGRRNAVVLVVTDTGEGIRPEDIPRIFDPFFSTKAQGTGLGLSITDGIVREHQGTIDVESVLGQGTRFILAFPALVTTPTGDVRATPA